MINLKEMQIVQSMMQDYSEVLANKRCNDWNFPENWTQKEKEIFTKHYYAWNGDPENYNPNYLHINDSSVAAFLAYKMTQDNNNYSIFIKTDEELHKEWILGYISQTQREEIYCIKDSKNFPLSITFTSGGLGVVVKLYDNDCKLLLDLTEY